MSTFDYSVPGVFARSVYGCNVPAENFRLKALLMLLGLGSLTHANNGTTSKLNTDFLIIPYQSAPKVKIGSVVSKFGSKGFNRKDLDDFFRNNLPKNHRLHKNIYNELKNAIGHHSSGSHIACYLYVYRLIEQVALCLPMVSIIYKGGFDNTFEEFKQLVDGKAKSDLSVLRKYSHKQLDSSVANSGVKLDFSRTSNASQCVRVVKRFITPDMIVSETADSVEFKYKYIEALIIGFRNQFFHYLFHEKNLSLTELENPDEFLSVCNPIFINYIAFLYYELLLAELTMWG